MLATYGFLDAEQAFSASLLLIMSNAALPMEMKDFPSMQDSLAILAKMAARGNAIVAAQHEALLQVKQRLGVDDLPQHQVGSFGDSVEQGPSSIDLVVQPSTAPLSEPGLELGSSYLADFSVMGEQPDAMASGAEFQEIELWDDALNNLGMGTEWEWINSISQSNTGG